MRVAVAGVVVPFALGFAYMKLRGDVSSEAVFVGAAMVATSVGITARIFADMRLLSTETAKIILGAAVFDDILGMIMLGFAGRTGVGRHQLAAHGHTHRGSGRIRALHDVCGAVHRPAYRAWSRTLIHAECVSGGGPCDLFFFLLYLPGWR